MGKEPVSLYAYKETQIIFSLRFQPTVNLLKLLTNPTGLPWLKSIDDDTYEILEMCLHLET